MATSLRKARNSLWRWRGLAGVGDPAGGHLQRGKQRGSAVPDIVVGAPLGPARPYRAGGLGPLQRLDLGLFVHAWE